MRKLTELYHQIAELNRAGRHSEAIAHYFDTKGMVPFMVSYEVNGQPHEMESTDIIAYLEACEGEDAVVVAGQLRNHERHGWSIVSFLAHCASGIHKERAEAQAEFLASTDNLYGEIIYTI